MATARIPPTTPPLLPLMGYTEAAAGARDGAKRALDHADRVHPSWGDDALAQLTQYAQRHPVFISEELRRHAHAHGLAEPPDGRAWGAVFTRAARLRVVIADGYAKARTRHNGPSTRWRSTVFIPPDHFNPPGCR